MTSVVWCASKISLSLARALRTGRDGANLAAQSRNPVPPHQGSAGSSGALAAKGPLKHAAVTKETSC